MKKPLYLRFYITVSIFCIMKRFLLFLTVALIAFSASAYNFVGKTFTGVVEEGDVKATVSIYFRTNTYATMKITMTGMKSKSDSRVLWEESGDFINLMDSTGTVMFIRIERDSEGLLLVLLDQGGNIMFDMRESATVPKAGKSNKRR